jgi:bacterioferritin
MLRASQNAGFNPFLEDLRAVRQSAKSCLASCPTAESRQDPVQTALYLLQSVIHAELVCIRRYTMISISPACFENLELGLEFQAQANDERKHVMMAAHRIEQLGGTADFSMQGIRLHGNGTGLEATNLSDLLEQNLVGEQLIIQHYHDLIEHFQKSDSLTGEMLQEMLSDEQNHTTDILDMLSPNGIH